MGGVVLAGFFANHGLLPQPEGTWKKYSIAAIQKISDPRHNHVKRSYHLVLDIDSTVIAIDDDIAPLFNSSLLQAQAKPTAVEVLSDHEAHDGIIRADGIRLLDGQVVLDADAVRSAHRPYEILGVVICSVVVLAGIGLGFRKGSRFRIRGASYK